MNAINLAEPMALGPSTSTMCLCEVDINYAEKRVTLVYSPPGPDGGPVPHHPHAQIEFLVDAPIPPKPPLWDVPEPNSDAGAVERSQYDMHRLQHNAACASYDDAMAKQCFTAWTSAEGTEIEKAHRFFAARRGLHIAK